MVVTAALRIIVITEDGGADSQRVVETILKRTATAILASGCRTNRIEFRPAVDQTVDGRERASILHANLWRVAKPDGVTRDRRVRLFQFLAGELSAKELPVFVVHHFDADVAWSNRASARTPRQWRESFADKVAAVLRGPADRLVPLVPYYSIEAWLYQNREGLDRIADGRGKPRIAEPERGWEEVHKPKAAVGWLGNNHNLELARTLPCTELHATGRSFTAAVADLRRVPGLVEALQSTVVG